MYNSKTSQSNCKNSSQELSQEAAAERIAALRSETPIPGRLTNFNDQSSTTHSSSEKGDGKK